MKSNQMGTTLVRDFVINKYEKRGKKKAVKVLRDSLLLYLLHCNSRREAIRIITMLCIDPFPNIMIHL